MNSHTSKDTEAENLLAAMKDHYELWCKKCSNVCSTTHVLLPTFRYKNCIEFGLFLQKKGLP